MSDNYPLRVIIDRTEFMDQSDSEVAIFSHAVEKFKQLDPSISPEYVRGCIVGQLHRLKNNTDPEIILSIDWSLDTAKERLRGISTNFILGDYLDYKFNGSYER